MIGALLFLGLGATCFVVALVPSLPSRCLSLIRRGRQSAKIARSRSKAHVVSPVVSVTNEHDRGALERCSRISGEVSK